MGVRVAVWELVINVDVAVIIDIVVRPSVAVRRMKERSQDVGSDLHVQRLVQVNWPLARLVHWAESLFDVHPSLGLQGRLWALLYHSV